MEKAKKQVKKVKVVKTIRAVPKMIDMPFKKKLSLAVSQKRKFCTSRKKRYGNVGDWFELMSEDGSHHDYELIAVRRHSLGYVTESLFLIEGVESPDAFIKLWEGIHQKREYDPDDKVWVHYFIPKEG